MKSTTSLRCYRREHQQQPSKQPSKQEFNAQAKATTVDPINISTTTSYDDDDDDDVDVVGEGY